MRLYEIDSPGTDLVLLFRTQISRADYMDPPQPVKMTWDELNAQEPNAPSYDYKSFSKEYDQNPTLYKTVVRRFDGDGIELNTKAKAQKEPPVSDAEKGRADITQMAKTATRKRM